MNVYTLREFRAKTREVFDKAQEGEEVIISRGVYTYKLVKVEERVHTEAGRVHKGPKRVHKNKDIGANVYTKTINKPIDVSKVIELGYDWKPCKHGYNPKFCRHAKPGRACK